MKTTEIIKKLREKESRDNRALLDEAADIIEMLSAKETPKKPIEVDEKQGSDYYHLAFLCPTCLNAVYGQPYRPNHCKHCGQKLDWGE